MLEPIHWKRRTGRLLLLAEAVVLILIVRNFLYVTTERLYLDGPQARPGASGAQRFEVEGARVVPEILVPSDDRIQFTLRQARASSLRFEARTAGHATYEVTLVAGDGEREVVARSLTSSRSPSCSASPCVSRSSIPRSPLPCAPA